MNTPDKMKYNFTTIKLRYVAVVWFAYFTFIISFRKFLRTFLNFGVIVTKLEHLICHDHVFKG